jgi:hypothetical protein
LGASHFLSHTNKSGCLTMGVGIFQRMLLHLIGKDNTILLPVSETKILVIWDYPASDVS